jgi:hypothetical protein
MKPGFGIQWKRGDKCMKKERIVRTPRIGFTPSEFNDKEAFYFLQMFHSFGVE